MIEHFWNRLPGPIWFNANAIYREQVTRARDGAVFVELGAWKGRSTSFMGVEIANGGTKMSSTRSIRELGRRRRVDHRRPAVKEGSLYEEFLRNIEPVREYVKPLRILDSEAAARFGKGSVDFVFADAGHTYEDVTNDLVAWWPKVRRVGVMAGDDWTWRDPKNGQYSVRQSGSPIFQPPLLRDRVVGGHDVS